MGRRPSRPAAGRAGSFQRVEEGVSDEGVEPLAFRRVLAKVWRIGASVPRRGVDGGDGGDKACGEARGSHEGMQSSRRSISILASYVSFAADGTGAGGPGRIRG